MGAHDASTSAATIPIRALNISSSSYEFGAGDCAATVRFRNGSKKRVTEAGESAAVRLLNEIHAIRCDIDGHRTGIAGETSDLMTPGLHHPAKIRAGISRAHHVVVEHHRSCFPRYVGIVAHHVNHSFPRHELEALRLEVRRTGR